MLQRLFGLSFLTTQQIDAFGHVLTTALLHNEQGIIEWATRAVADAGRLNRLRDRDVATLQRLERHFNGSQFYSSYAPRSAGAIAA
jgi:hypothetical protein